MDPDERPTGIFAASDRLAVAACAAAHDLDLVVGRDLAVVGCDDTEVACQLRPTLSSVDQDGRRIGRRAVEMLLALLAGQSMADEVLPVRLVVRESPGGCRCSGRRRKTGPEPGP